MTNKPGNPHAQQTLTPEDVATLQGIRVTLTLNRLLIVAILTYGAYDCLKAYTPIGPWIYGIFAAIAYLMRPTIPEALRKKIKGD